MEYLWNEWVRGGGWGVNGQRRIGSTALQAEPRAVRLAIRADYRT
jgi:hypothetical protein